MKWKDVFFFAAAICSGLFSPAAYGMGCFGLELGDDISKYVHEQPPVHQSDQLKMFEVSPAAPHILFDTYAVDTYDEKIIRIMASSPDDYSADAGGTLNAYKKIRQELTVKYGEPAFSFDDIDDAGNDLLDYLVVNDGIEVLEWVFPGTGNALKAVYVFLRGIEDEDGKFASYCTLYLESEEFATVSERIRRIEIENWDVNPELP